MPTYVLDKLKRTVSTQKIADAADLDGKYIKEVAFASGVITVTFQNSSGAEDTLDISIPVVALVLPGVASKEYVEDSAITSFILPSASGGTTPYTYSVTGLPAGLSFSTTTRAVSGTPSTPGDYEVSYQVSDGDSSTFTVVFDIKVTRTGHRYTGVSSNSVPSESELTEEFGPLEEDLELPTWGLGTRYLLIAQPASQDDLTGISLSGGGNSISAFTKYGSTITIDGISYEIWVSNEPQGQVISGYNISVRS